jgi:hypothetical protein
MDFFRKRRDPIDFSSIASPWDSDRISIYAHLQKHQLDGELGLAEAGFTLPDETDKGDNELRWAPGASDGAFSHHGNPGNEVALARRVAALMRDVLSSGDAKKLAELYGILRDSSSIDFIDPLIEEVAKKKLFDNPSFYTFSKWMTKSAPDREAVKTAMALLGICASDDDKEIFFVLGTHDEFTLYAAVAIGHSAKDAERDLFRLAKAVHGWGRIHVVERLVHCESADIKAWMLRGGYRNNVMYEYTAFMCATSGNLLNALSVADPDEQLIAGACEIIDALINGGPAEDMSDYPDGPEATLRLLQHLSDRDPTLTQLETVIHIREYLAQPVEQSGWKNVEAEISSLIESILSRPDWKQRVLTALDSDNESDFGYAAALAPTFGIDVWERYFTRVQTGKSDNDWYFLMQTKDESRIRRVVQLAEQLIPLDQVATGYGDALGLGPDFRHHHALDFVLQDMRNWPQCGGYSLVAAGLNSPVTRNRNMALMCLKAWGRQHWPADTERELQSLLAKERNDSTRDLIKELLASI